MNVSTHYRTRSETLHIEIGQLHFPQTFIIHMLVRYTVYNFLRTYNIIHGKLEGKPVVLVEPNGESIR